MRHAAAAPYGASLCTVGRLAQMGSAMQRCGGYGSQTGIRPTFVRDGLPGAGSADLGSCAVQLQTVSPSHGIVLQAYGSMRAEPGCKL